VVRRFRARYAGPVAEAKDIATADGVIALPRCRREPWVAEQPVEVGMYSSEAGVSRTAASVALPVKGLSGS